MLGGKIYEPSIERVLYSDIECSNDPREVKMVRSSAMLNRLGKTVSRLNFQDSIYLSLRVEYLLIQIDSVLSAQYKHLMTFTNGTDLLNRLDEAMSAAVRFKNWFREIMRTQDKFTLERYLSHGVGVEQKESKTVRKILSRIMIFLPRWVNFDVGGCFCAKPQVLQELYDGYRISILQGTYSAFDFNS